MTQPPFMIERLARNPVNASHLLPFLVRADLNTNVSDLPSALRARVKDLRQCRTSPRSTTIYVQSTALDLLDALAADARLASGSKSDVTTFIVEMSCLHRGPAWVAVHEVGKRTPKVSLALLDMLAKTINDARDRDIAVGPCTVAERDLVELRAAVEEGQRRDAKRDRARKVLRAAERLKTEAVIEALVEDAWGGLSGLETAVKVACERLGHPTVGAIVGLPSCACEVLS